MCNEFPKFVAGVRLHARADEGVGIRHTGGGRVRVGVDRDRAFIRQ